MAKTLFPILPPAPAPQTAAARPLYREVAWDFERDVPIFRGGEPVLVEGLEAVRVWAYHAVRTPRYLHEIYSFGYGCELVSLTGSAYSEDTKLAEAVRYLREALLSSPYITEVAVSDAVFSGSDLSMHCRITTLYGEVTMDV